MPSPENEGSPLDETRTKQLADALSSSPRLTIPISAFHDNIDQEIITVTCDRLKLRLLEHLGNVEGRRAWFAPLGVLLTTLAALLTASFTTFLGVDGAIWHAVFIMSMAGSAVWLMVSLLRLPKRETVDDVVDSLRHSREQTSPSALMAPPPQPPTVPPEPESLPRKLARDAAPTRQTIQAKKADRATATKSHEAPSYPKLSLCAGDTVIHKTFGRGAVTVVEGDRITVEFDQPFGTKTLLDGFAPMALFRRGGPMR